jgi:hypothetical protein
MVFIDFRQDIVSTATFDSSGYEERHCDANDSTSDPKMEAGFVRGLGGNIIVVSLVSQHHFLHTSHFCTSGLFLSYLLLYL